MDEFVQAVMARWPNAVLQFEDFNLKHAHPLLNRYRDYHTVFNDDIQASSYTLHLCVLHPQGREGKDSAQMLCFAPFFGYSIEAYSLS